MPFSKKMFLLISAGVIAPIAILVAIGVSNTILDLVNPCFSWGSVGGGSVAVSTNGPCTSAGGSSETIAQTIFGFALIGGGILIGAILGVLGVAKGRPALLVIGSVILFAESAPLIFGGEFVFTLLPLDFSCGRQERNLSLDSRKAVSPHTRFSCCMRRSKKIVGILLSALITDIFRICAGRCYCTYENLNRSGTNYDTRLVWTYQLISFSESL